MNTKAIVIKSFHDPEGQILNWFLDCLRSGTITIDYKKIEVGELKELSKANHYMIILNLKCFTLILWMKKYARLLKVLMV